MFSRLRKNAIVYNPATSKAGFSCDVSMLFFLRLLQQRYQILIDASSPSDHLRAQELRPLLTSLALAEAILEKNEWLGQKSPHPIHIAIVGPTQAGKSSVINWLTSSSLAEASPLAGFTVHPQGFALSRDAAQLDALDDYFHDYQRLSRDHLDHRQLNAFSLESAQNTEPSPTLRNTILWDTPDFDSVQSREYQNAVLRVAGLADVIILVVSKDKYADLSVWEFMRLLEPLAQPTLLLLNKTDADSRLTLLRSVEDKWRSFRADPAPPIIPIPYLTDPAELASLGELHDQAMARLQVALGKVDRSGYARAGQRLIKKHWPAWTAPIIFEHRLTAEWNMRLDRIIGECMDRYQRDYLDHPNHYETFQRALAELLTLLEIPGIGSALLHARRLVTWPVKQISKLGQLAAGHHSAVDGGEPAILHQIAEHAFVRISEDLMLNGSSDPVEQRWWGNLNHQVMRQRGQILVQFDQATHAYVENFQPEIDKTAHGLFEHLQEHPMVLNSLRATRVTTDAAALAIALHTGGIGVQDLVIAPAMLSVTTLLTESALGQFMNKSAERLRSRQREAVAILLNAAIRERLAAVPDQIDPSSRVGIPPEILNQAAVELR
jgi:GTPase SAR1 family protein